MRERVKKGQKQIDVEEALQTYGDMVYRLALVQMKNRSEAEDVFQEVFLRLVRYRDRIQGEDHLKPWLLRVTVNCCRKQFDNAYRKRTVHIEQEMAAEETYEMELPGNPVYDAVAGLPDDYFTSTRVFDRCDESYDAYPNLIAKKWIDDPEWQESSMWYRMLGRDGVTFDPFDENPNYFRCHPSCKMRYLGNNDYFENYGTEQFPFCEVCKELFRDTLSFASNTNTLHFQPYNDQFYTETPFSFNDWHFIFRSRNGEEAIKVYGEDLPQGDVLTYTVTDAAGKVVKDASGKAMQDLTVQDTMNFTTAGTYTVTAQYSGSFGELSCSGEFEVKPATVIAEVGEMTREWQAGTAMALPEIKIDLAAAQAGFVRASDVEIEYARHSYDARNEEVGRRQLPQRLPRDQCLPLQHHHHLYA